MSEWNELQKQAKEAGVYEHGMTADDIRTALGVGQEQDSNDRSVDRGRTDDRVVQMGRRRQRTPMGGFRQKIKVPYPQEGWYYHCFLDEDDKIMRALDAGFIPVLTTDPEFGGSGEGLGDNDPLPDRDEWASVTGNRRTAKPVKQFYMKQRMEFHLEDQAYKHRQVDQTERGIKEQEQRDEDGNRVNDSLTYGEFNINQFQR